jgi:asparagine synthase (glutamine-hydrolysing)
MCGIAGILTSGPAANADPQALIRMLSCMHYRGPDENGIYLDDRIGLGQVRLSIIDLSSGRQPISNEDGTIWIVFNGEIFNYLELREELENRGHHFSTKSDTEVMIHLYEERGEEMLSELNGQWAIALWDSKKELLMLSRDRVGIRPLYYASENNRFYFASEIKAIFAGSSISPRIDPQALDQVFTFWSTLPGQSPFQGIEELEPGSTMLVEKGKRRARRYWDLPFFPPSEYLRDSPEDIAQNIRDLFRDSIKIRLRADVPVGAYLSGGLDSSAVSAIVAREVNPHLKTFGVRFDEEGYDEGYHQNEMVRYLGCEHHDIVADHRTIGEAFKDVIWHCEKPLLRTAPVPLFILSKLVVDNGIKVVLTGEGSDEFFGGYDIFKEALIRAFCARQPKSQRRPLLFTRLYPDIFRDPASRRALPYFFSQGIDQAADPFFSHKLRWRNTSRIKQFYSPDFAARLDGYDAVKQALAFLPPDFSKLDTLSKAQYLEARFFLSNYLLSSQGDRVAMAHSIEIRMPFLDRRLIEQAGRIPTIWKILGLNEKFILKKALQGIVPESVRNRTKHPYRAPVHKSLLHFASTEYGAHVLSEAEIKRHGIFNPVRVSSLMEKARSKEKANETEAMAMAGIASTQILGDRFSRTSFAQVPSCKIHFFVDKRSRRGSSSGQGDG